MALLKLSLESLATLDAGRLAAAFAVALKNVEADLKDRPGVGTARTISLTASFTPVSDDRGDLESTDVVFQVSDSVPKRKSNRYNMRADREGFLFNEMSPTAARQHTIDEPQPSNLKKVN